jgi:hypothetical protein
MLQTLTSWRRELWMLKWLAWSLDMPLISRNLQCSAPLETNLSPIRSQPATCMDGEMRTFAVYSSLPVRSHDYETAGRRCTSAAAFQRLLLPHGL